VVKVVENEAEADIVCGLLRANGIECFSRDTEAIDSEIEDFIEAGPREIVVRAVDADAAKELLETP
jgi:putative signal transducing protein